MSMPAEKRRALLVKAQESAVFTAHLASDRNRFYTACGEPWQGWQEPFDADLHIPADRYVVLPPHRKPRPHVDQIRPCQACLRHAMEYTPAGHEEAR